MKAYVETVDDLRFHDWRPVRSASAIAPFGDGWLIAQDDATHAAWRRGNLLAGLPSASVDVPVAQLVAALTGALAPADVAVGARQVYELGDVDGVGLAVTDAVALPDGRVLVSAAAEDTPNAVDDGPVVAAALALVHGDDPLDVVVLETSDDEAHKVEGLGLAGVDAGGCSLVAVAVVDADDPLVPSLELSVRVDWKS